MKQKIPTIMTIMIIITTTILKKRINNGTTSFRNMKQEIWLCQFDWEFIVVRISGR
jgi:hypothetical protein